MCRRGKHLKHMDEEMETEEYHQKPNFRMVTDGHTLRTQHVLGTEITD